LYRFSPTSQATPCTVPQLILTMYPISGWEQPKVQLPYSPTDLHQIRNQPYPLQRDFENVPDFRFSPVKGTTTLFPTDFLQIRKQPHTLPTYFKNVSDSGSGMSRVQLPYSPTDFHQIWQQPYHLPTDFENVPDSGSSISRAQLSYSLPKLQLSYFDCILFGQSRYQNASRKRYLTLSSKIIFKKRGPGAALNFAHGAAPSGHGPTLPLAHMPKLPGHPVYVPIYYKIYFLPYWEEIWSFHLYCKL